MKGQPIFSRAGLIHLLVVYIVWGSTYLAIRVGVRPGSGFTPFVLGSLRTLTAAAILLAWGALTHQRMRPTRLELVTLVGAGVLLWVAGNGLVMVGEQRVDSSLAALVVACVPLWSAVIEAIIDRKVPSLLLIGSLLIGIAGIAVLSMPVFLKGVQADAAAVLVIVFASICWAGGTVLQSRNRVALAPQVNSGYQTLFGSLGFVAMALILHEPLPHPVLSAWAAWAYLVLFGSVLAFTSFTQALRLLPTKVVTTYSYVNPVIAVFLGWLILREPVTIWTVLGAGLVLLGVAGVFRAHNREQAAEARAVIESSEG
jgi:drug/metabolite transporter (DMT)-like permease